MGGSVIIKVGYLLKGEGYRLFYENVLPVVQCSLGACIVVGGRSDDVQHIEFYRIQQVIDRRADVRNSVRLCETMGRNFVDIGYGNELCGIQGFDKAGMVFRDLAAADDADAQPRLP